MRQKYVATMLDALRFDLERLERCDSKESNFSISTKLLEEYEDAIVMASAMLRGTTLLGFNKEGMKYD
tara:strand:- start:222 stop:425 length:204 start_codon:yes stop_codon:yes gene_type:complete